MQRQVNDAGTDKQMPEVLHIQRVETAIHDASGAVKLHIAANDHLDRLFAADGAEIPWFLSLYQALHDVFKPEKLPPLELTSRPVAVKSIWGLYGPDRKSWNHQRGTDQNGFYRWLGQPEIEDGKGKAHRDSDPARNGRPASHDAPPAVAVRQPPPARC